MFLGMPLGAMLRRLPLFALVCVLGFMQVVTAFAQTQPPPQPGGIQFRICDHPPTCFASREARQDWARQNNCRFLEDVCEKAPGKGGGWGEGALGQFGDAIQFGNGLLNGLKDQLGDLWHMVTNLGEVLEGIGALATSFVNDPVGTVAMLGQLLGQEAVDALTKATQCGAYDLGKVIGSYVSPALALKLTKRLVQYGGKLDKAVDSLKPEYGCASFGAGTLVLTPTGMIPIERINRGQEVASRHETSFDDRAQGVVQTFDRIAPSYRLLATDAENYRITDEHPLWVQGKGWTEAKAVVAGDVLAGAKGDVLVVRNDVVSRPLRVFNFGVAGTSNYFVGTAGIWAHNARCPFLRGHDGLIGKSEGGPGTWEKQNRSGGVEYQEQVVGVKRGIEYEVPCASTCSGKVMFDGYDPDRGVLLDAKDWNKWPPADRGDIWQEDTAREARNQIAAAKGTPIEWHFSNQETMEVVKAYFESQEITGITFVFAPRELP